ncbi:NAD(P)H-dependent oxidoreductase [Ruegeria arenilitoris]|uniref:NAD(P)H-dependent oxidoreductase n=1 Tax=Ruegeria arenilitoris TaxID=1173585 RepID=UPI00147DD596|nr:NAD(P)H-dependent oxidoreductase [Ruegeria arenilitoris]
MKALVVSATPEPQSFIASMADLSVRVLEEQGYQVAHSNLYEMGWNPVASANDFGDRKDPDYLTYALEQRHGVEGGTIAPDISAELQKLMDADLLVLNFPIYWFSVPAILKGWLDRVIVSGLCYGGRRFYDQGGLSGKRALVAATLGGRPHMFGPESIHGPIETMLRPLLQGTLAYTGMNVIEPFFGWHVPYIQPEERAQILDDYAVCLKSLDERQLLEFPSMADFSRDLHPLKPNLTETA